MNCKKGAVQLISQIIATIKIMDQTDYDRPMDIYNGSTMGKHFRHIYDFFNCLVVQSDQAVIDYCLRARDEGIESNRDFAIELFEALKLNLAKLDETKEIIVKADFEIEDKIRPQVNTTIGREVMYAYDHAVHHLAIVKIGLNLIRPDLQINQDLGVAASTIRHQHAHG